MSLRHASGALTEAMLRQLVGESAAGIVIMDTGLRFRYVNDALARMGGLSAEEHIGRRIDEVLPRLDVPLALLRQVLADGRPRELTASGHTQVRSSLDRRYWHGSFHRLEEDGEVVGVAGVLMEITAARHIQRDLEQTRERLALLDDAGTRIGSTLDVDTTCQELADFLVPTFADLVTVEVFPPERADAALTVDPEQPILLRRAALASLPWLRSALESIATPGDLVTLHPGSRIPLSLATGRASMLDLPSYEDLTRISPDPARVAVYRRLRLHSAAVVPLIARGVPLGVLTMGRTGESPAFTEDDMIVAHDLAGRAAVSLDNARRYTREHGIAVELQRALLSQPSTPHAGIEVAARYLPAGSSALVGGDWYDSIRRPFGRTLLAMGDVMGHGVEAAVDMSAYRSMLRVVGSADLPPHRVLRQLDTMISASEGGRPATCLLALADPARGKLSCSSAGHLPPAMLRPGGPTELLQVPGGPPLGTGFGGYEPVTVPWRIGDVLLLFTDGLVERRGEDIDDSLDRLRGLCLPTEGDLDRLVDRVLEHMVPTAGTAEDDVAVMAARIRPRRSLASQPEPD